MKPVLSNRRAAAVLFVVLTTFTACNRDPASIATGSPNSAIPFPDWITRGGVLPPRANTESFVALGDTVFYGGMGAPPVITSERARLVASLTIRDTSRSSLRYRNATLAACPFSVELFRVDATNTPVWRSSRATGSASCPPLQGDNPSDVSISWDAAAVLGDSLPSGQYVGRMQVKLADGRALPFATPSPIYLDASSSPVSLDYRVLHYTASAVVEGQAPRMVRATVFAVNTGTRSLFVETGGCPTKLRLHRSADSADAPIWRSEFRRPAGTNAGYGCAASVVYTVVPPRDSMRFQLEVPWYEVLGDSLPAGRYFASIELSLLAQEFPVRAPSGVSLKLAAGPIDLTRDPDRLPTSRVIAGVSYAATTRIVGGRDGADTVRTLVLITNGSPKRFLTTVASACPVIAYAYNAAALRDSVPVQNTSIRIQSDSCAFDNYPIALDPGQSWVFGRDISVAEFRSRFGTGRFWFTAWATVEQHVVLATGDILVR